MPNRSQFIPGRLVPPTRPLADYRPHQPAGAVADYARALTSPGDLVVDLFCQGPTFVREAVETGRRAVGFSINPLLLLSARLGLSSPDPQALSSAFAYLATSLKGDRPLQSHMTSLYHSGCPTCGSRGVAEWFAWDRDLGYPFEKGVRCPDCGDVQSGPTDRDDVVLAHTVAPRGLAYYYALDRAAPVGHPARDRAAALVDCYTPRNLSALMDLSRRVEALEVVPSVKEALMAVLLDCFDRGSKLYPYGEDRRRPHALRTPPRYLERNIWDCFERGFVSLKNDPSQSLAGEAEVAELLVTGGGRGYALLPRAARKIGDVLPPASVPLVLVDPPRPDGVFWALSALWATWLWKSPSAHAMRPLLRRRRFDWDWHWSALREALTAVGSRLTPRGTLITLFADSTGALLESVCLATCTAGYELGGWGYAPEVGYRLVWHWQGRRVGPSSSPDALDEELSREAQRATLRLLGHRGEPTADTMVRTGAYASLVESSLLSSTSALEHDQSVISLAAQAVDESFDKAPIVQLGRGRQSSEPLWWLADKPEVLDPLADRVEEAVRRMLVEGHQWRPNELTNAVYAQFPNELTPDLTLVEVCIESYGEWKDEGIRVRPEDEGPRRRREIDQIRKELAAMGDGIGYDACADGNWDVRWLEEGQEVYVFSVSPTATVARYLLDDALRATEGQRCLVVPGSRARLIDLKLKRDPRLASAVAAQQWQFIKFRHLRRLKAKKNLDHHDLKTVLGLDPIVEREGAQIPLF